MSKYNHVVKGKFDYKPDKKKKKGKLSNKEQAELLKKEMKKQDKKLHKQCVCNHIDRKHGEPHWHKYTNDSNVKIRKCKICGGEIYEDRARYNTASIEAANKILYSAISVIRNNLSVNEETDKKLVNAMLVNAKVSTMMDMVTKNDKKDKKNKNKNGNKKKKNKKNKFSRVKY